MKIIDVKQNTDEWLRARAGIPTASEFDNLITPEWKNRTGGMPETYLYRKLCEKVMGMPLQSGGAAAGSFHTDQGSIMENEALPWFMFEHDMQVDRVGFVTTDDGRVGCSPDGLIGEDGGIEAKCPAPDTHLKYLLHGEVPKQYLAQVHGSMFVTGRAWWYFLSYSRQFPPFVLKVQRDEKIVAALKDTLGRFFEVFDDAYDQIMVLKNAANAAKQAAYEAAADHSR